MLPAPPACRGSVRDVRLLRAHGSLLARALESARCAAICRFSAPRRRPASGASATSWRSCSGIIWDYAWLALKRGWRRQIGFQSSLRVTYSSSTTRLPRTQPYAAKLAATISIAAAFSPTTGFTSP